MPGKAWFHVVYLNEQWEEMDEFTSEDMRPSEVIEAISTWMAVHVHQLAPINGAAGLDVVYHIEIEVTHER